MIALLTLIELPAQQFVFSRGLYRMPYEDSLELFIFSDIWTHNSPGKYDMWPPEADKLIVAAADGWIRGIQESFDTTCFCCPQFNNYVIIEHPNGEWSGYTHVAVNSVSGQGIVLNQFVTVGTPIGVEGNVGCSGGRHLHWEVGVPTDPSNPFQVSGGFINGQQVIPVICGIGSEPWLVQGGTYPSGPCDDNCENDYIVDTSLANGDEFVARADNSVLTSTEDAIIYNSGSVAQFRAGDFIRMLPGFQAESGARFEAFIKSCNAQ